MNYLIPSIFITQEAQPILLVSHEDDEGGSLWQFHSGDGDYDEAKMQLVRLDTIFKFDPEIYRVSDLPLGYIATRKSKNDKWVYEKEK